MEQKNLIADGMDVLLPQLPVEQLDFELPSRIALPEKIFLTRKFDPTFCTCGKHCSHEPQYHMERTVFRLDLLSVPTSVGDLEVCIKEKLKAANFIIDSTEVCGENETEPFHSKKIAFVKELVARLRDVDVHRLQDYFGKEGRITLTGFDGVLLCRQRKKPSKTKSVNVITQKAVSHEGVSAEVTTQIYQARKTAKERICPADQKADKEHKDIDRYNESKGARLYDKPDFNKEMADIVQAYGAEYKECKENDNESVAKRVDVTDAFDSDFAPEINFVSEKIKSQISVDERKVGYVPCLSTTVRDDVVVAPDISTSKKKEQVEISGISSESIVVPGVTCDFSHQMKGIVQAYEAEYAEAKKIQDQTTNNITDPFEKIQDDFESEPDYSLLEFEEENNTGDNKTVPQIGQAEYSCPVFDGRLEAEAKSFRVARDVTEIITSVVKEPTTFYADIADIVKAYEAEVDESKEIDERKLSDTLDTVHSGYDDGEFEETLKHAFFISTMERATSVAKESVEDIDCSFDRLNKATETPEDSDSAEYTENLIDAVFRRRHDFDEGLEKLSESVVSTVLEHISERVKMKETQESHTYRSEFVNGTERNTEPHVGLISDLALAVSRKAEAKDIKRDDEECCGAPKDIEREELKAVDAQAVINVSDSSEIGMEIPASSISETQEADAIGVFPQVDNEAAEDNSDDELPEDFRHFTPEVSSTTLPVIACYDDEDDGLSPYFGILAVYCESEIHASWGGTHQGLVETV